jgi:uncharacterized coiled-coil protein SlyX
MTLIDLECRLAAHSILMSEVGTRIARLEIALESTRDQVDILQSLLAEHIEEMKNETN